MSAAELVSSWAQELAVTTGHEWAREMMKKRSKHITFGVGGHVGSGVGVELGPGVG